MKVFLCGGGGDKQTVEVNKLYAGMIVGGSAGAIIFGKDIKCSDYADENIIGLEDTSGFNILYGYDICCHYKNRDEERNTYEYNYILNYSKEGNKVLALTEETHLFVEDNKFTVIGQKECTVFENGLKRAIECKAAELLNR